ncbi:MAG: M2 family metallopeptidase [Acidobacteriota bacterium]
MLAPACRKSPPPPTAADAAKFLAGANATMLRLGRESQQAGWVYSTYITPDTEDMNARAQREFLQAVTRDAAEAAKFDTVSLAPDARRQLDLLKLSLDLVTPANPAQAEELTKLGTSLEATYGRGKWCPDPATPAACLDINKITEIMATSRDERQLRATWEGWQTVGVPMRRDYQRFVELANVGAKELGFADLGALWRLKYDMPADAFTTEVDRLWAQVRPLYVSLHAYMRMKLREKYGDAVPAAGPIPAHLLGNIWAQDWSNVYDLVKPVGSSPDYSLTEILKRRQTTPTDMVRMGERFYTSLGFAPLPPTFWERSLLVKPPDRDVVCHASAWDIDLEDDLRIKMCMEPTAEDFLTIHHELGHNFYQRAYKGQLPLFRDSANQAFHEAIGDTVALSVTPEYLVKIGLLGSAPDASKDTGLLLSKALEKVAFLPFSLLIDQWRWNVFSGAISPADYNKAWWDLRLKYQGIQPPSPRGEQFFDPGAKYHVPANYSYTRYFLADILQFQFHRELSKIAGCTTPLHRCSIYGNAEAGKRLNAMLQMGQSKPWPDALEALTGSRQMDASAIIDYFAPLKAWLDDQIKGQPVGWEGK